MWYEPLSNEIFWVKNAFSISLLKWWPPKPSLQMVIRQLLGFLLVKAESFQISHSEMDFTDFQMPQMLKGLWSALCQHFASFWDGTLTAAPAVLMPGMGRHQLTILWKIILEITFYSFTGWQTKRKKNSNGICFCPEHCWNFGQQPISWEKSSSELSQRGCRATVMCRGNAAWNLWKIPFTVIISLATSENTH